MRNRTSAALWCLISSGLAGFVYAERSANGCYSVSVEESRAAIPRKPGTLLHGTTRLYFVDFVRLNARWVLASF